MAALVSFSPTDDSHVGCRLAILSARQHIDPIFLDTPAVNHPALDDHLGCSLVAKVETLNPIRSFKGRGTELFVATEIRPGDVLVCASAGNFGQGLARAATKRGYPCVVFAAANANPLKVVAMKRLGADVRLVGADFDAAKDAARAYAREAGARFVEDGAEPAMQPVPGTDWARACGASAGARRVDRASRQRRAPCGCRSCLSSRGPAG